ncbi:MAG: bifunctional nuclease family protein [Tannerellaceae bacterium]|nr:bifunctional nuclease family protein [Tannerellaceae bacterium]
MKVKLRVQGLTSSQIQSGTYALILAEENGPRRIPIIVGMAEAQSIAIALEHITPPRPLTHDLFSYFFDTFDIHLLEVYIYKFEEGVFFSELLFEKEGQQYRVDSRTSDAIAIALRVKCDIFTGETIIQECGIELEETILLDDEDEENEIDDEDDDEEEDEICDLEPEDINNDVQMNKWLSMLEKKGLESRLNEAIINEKYEHAKMYRDELRRREAKGGGKTT